MPVAFQCMNRREKGIGNISGMAGYRLVHFQIPHETAGIGHQRAMSCGILGDLDGTTDAILT